MGANKYTDPDVRMSVHVARQVKRIERLGLRLVFGSDFYEFRDRAVAADAKVSHSFDSQLVDIMPNAGFWIAAETRKGKAVHFQAVRRDDLQGVKLATHWRTLGRLHDGVVGERHCPAADRITGVVAYHGNMWIADKYRHSGIANPACLLTHALAYQKFRPDYIYAFIETGLVLKGMDRRFGYLNAEPVATEWTEGPEGISRNDWIMWNDRAQLLWLASKSARIFGKG